MPVINGTSGNDTLIGTSSGDEINGFNGNDSLNGGIGRDTLVGGAGNDTLNGGVLADLGNGDFGNLDIADYSGSPAAVNVNLQTGLASDGDGGIDTLINIEGVRGSAFNDIIVGDGNINLLNGSSGDDSLAGGDGNDILNGNSGTDTLNGGNGDDLIIGGDGGTTSDGNDLLIGGSGNDNLIDFDGDDTLEGGEGNDRLRGGANNDLLSGGPGNDTLEGGAGDDTFVIDGASSDVIAHIVLSSGDVIDVSGAGSGFFTLADVVAAATDNGVDTVIDLGGGNTLTLINVVVADLSANNFIFETTAPTGITIIGTGGPDTITGSSGDDFLDGAGGDDIIEGGDGADTLVGGTGFDFLIGGNGDDLLIDGNTSDAGLLSGGPGNDTIDGGYFYEPDPAGVIVNLSDSAITVDGITVNARTALDGYGDTDTLGPNAVNGHGSAFADFIIGSADGQNFFLGRGNDTVDGGAGNDLFFGGPGNDVINGGEGSDQAAFGGFGFDLSGTPTQGADVDLAAGTATDQFGDTDTLVSIERVVGSMTDDTLRGDGNANFFSGANGDDLIETRGAPTGEFNFATGGAGNDTLRGGGDTDVLRGGDGGDTLEGGGNSQLDLLEGGAGNDLLIGGDTGIAILRGNAGNDTLVGGDGIDEANYLRATSGVSASLRDGQASNDGDGGVDTLIDIDRINGSRYNDWLEGDKAGNILAGFDGDDRLDGLKGADTLFGDAGNDTLNGGKGKDLLNGGGGDDILTGGKGKDVFVFDAGTGNDTVTDFSINHDMLDLAGSATDFTDLADVELAAGEAMVGGVAGLLIDLGDGDSLFLAGLGLNDLANIDFLF